MNAIPQRILFEIHPDDQQQLTTEGENGIDFQYIFASLNHGPNAPTVIFGARYAIPVTHPRFYSLQDLASGLPLPVGTQLGSLRVNAYFPNFNLATANLQLPAGYLPSPGAFTLIGTDTLKYPTTFYRFIADPVPPIGPAIDARYVNNNLTKNTYLTTQNDSQFVNSGFGAVGRYSLPLPTPASNIFIYQLPAGTMINVGTVAPLFGQTGGGVEISLCNRTSAILLRTARHPNY